MKSNNTRVVVKLMVILTLSACAKNGSGLMKTNGIENSSVTTGNVTTINTISTVIHPGMLHTAADFTRMTTNVNAGREPWLSGWNKLVANGHSSPSYVPRPVDTIVRGKAASGAPENYILACQDAAAAYQEALRWKIKGDVACGNNAIKIMNAWASICTGMDGDSNQALAAGLQGYQWANASEIMRSYSGWAPADFTRFKNFLLNVYYPVSYRFLNTHNGTCDTHYWLNWDMSNLCTVLAIGILCDDTAKINYAINYYAHTGVGNGFIGRVASKIYPNGMAQPQEAGRDQGHATMEVPLLGAFCIMANNQGVNLMDYNPWNEINPRLLAVSEYIAAYNINTSNTVPYTTYNNCNNVNQTVIAAAGRGVIRPGWELIYNYYVKQKGKSAPYSTQFAALVRPEGGGGDYGVNSGSYDQLGFGTLTFSR
ncbi:alginate lyase family protein [Mucilaginibacter sp. BT774]|uniref:alginate lyase family protein n=1 Tax=Mucilaginibacter sp. BT774 TaxID=3062276 RepID=UPI002675BFF8|nr:alginate lyase family protein [Mucilaginibacter sp. BT774]MDO3626264.1 alginate lyase family protein [Mucilaginibacter sp. BT774]